MLILVIGDLHIPQRKLRIPDQFLKLIVPGKLDKVLCIGNLTTSDQMKWLKTISNDITAVSGDLDDSMVDVTESAIISIGGCQFGLIHGHQVIPWGDPERLASQAREMGVDVLISGQTHIPSVSTYENKLFLNPGSLTGAYSNISSSSVPSFMILDIKKSQITVYNYQINESGEVEVSHYKHSTF